MRFIATSRILRHPALLAGIAMELVATFSNAAAPGALGKPLQPIESLPKAPALALRDEEGKKTWRLSDLRGKVVLVNFWATWCPPCVEEIPSLDRLRERLAPRGFEVLAVDVGEPRDQVKAFLEARPVRFPVLLDATGETFKRWKAYAFPTSLLLDRRHRVRYSVYGAFVWDSPEVIEAVSRLLDES
jgi:thiol-disulfide isomerase/thioredoxin